MQRARDTFWLYLLQNLATIGLALLIGRHSLGGLTASVSIAYLLAAVVALAALAARGAPLWTELAHPAIGRSLVASVAGALAAALVYAAEAWPSGPGLWVRLCAAILAGVVVYGGLQVLGHRRHERHRGPPVRRAS
jgi:hypothetical protein